MPEAIVVSEQDVAVIEREQQRIVTVAAGSPGVQGPPGGGETLVAAVPLSGHRVVTTDAVGDAIYADNATLAHAQAVIGVSTNASGAGGIINIVTLGFVDHAWGFAPGDQLWLGAAGAVTNVPPSGPGIFSRSIGYAVTATRIFVVPQTPVDTV